jgi:hypothetical protein
MSGKKMIDLSCKGRALNNKLVRNNRDGGIDMPLITVIIKINTHRVRHVTIQCVNS